MNKLRTTLALAALSIASLASADPIDVGTYQLGNHPAGNAANPLYGLRLDRLLYGSSDPHKIYTFDFEADDGTTSADMRMTWDGTSLRIFGNAFGGRDVGSSYDSHYSDWWQIDFVYSDFWNCGGNLCSRTGSGSITSTVFGAFHLTSQYSENHGYGFQLRDGIHRGYTGINGWGWINHCSTSSNEYSGADCAVHQYSSDWLFTAHPVPEPGTLLLFGAGLLGLAFVRRRQRQLVRTDV